MDRALLADFLRARREALQPEDVGLPRGGTRRRASGLRREEVAVLAGMSADYYSRIEQQRGPMPSEQVLAALARGLKLSPGEREHLFALGGHSAPRRALRDERVSPAMQRIVERLADTPAIVFSQFGEALLQTRGAVALFGDYTSFNGMSRYLVYRWYTDPAQRAIYPPEDHDLRGRVFTVDLRAVYTADPAGTAGEIVEALLAVSPEFAEVWRRHEVDVTHHHALKRYVHPELGDLEMHSWRLMDPDESQDLLVFMAEPGSPSEERLQRLGGLPR